MCIRLDSMDLTVDIRWGAHLTQPFGWGQIRRRFLELLKVPWGLWASRTQWLPGEIWIACPCCHLGRSRLYEEQACRLCHSWSIPAVLSLSSRYPKNWTSYLRIHKPEAPFCFIFSQALLDEELNNLLCNTSPSASGAHEDGSLVFGWDSRDF